MSLGDLKTMHAGYEVHAYAHELVAGGYSPEAVVTSQKGEGTADTVIQIGPPHEFDDADAAATHALHAAIHWIDDHG